MPKMDPARWRAASLRLDEALELTGDQRAQWMAALREQDPQLADDVYGLLEEYDVVREEGFLEGQCVRPADAAADAVAAGLAPAGFAGRIIGAYPYSLERKGARKPDTDARPYRGWENTPWMFQPGSTVRG